MRHKGLSPAMGPPRSRELRHQPFAPSTVPHTTGPLDRKGRGIRCWAPPCSLAVTEGILVSFFSSAY